tara:strand:+ start:1548 stop:1649 length:102 start_codon:yes stop_codon:yes gene_type:complete
MYFVDNKDCGIKRLRYAKNFFIITGSRISKMEI